MLGRESCISWGERSIDRRGNRIDQNEKSAFRNVREAGLLKEIELPEKEEGWCGLEVIVT